MPDDITISIDGVEIQTQPGKMVLEAAIEAGRLNPAIDRRFAFADAREAYRCMEAAGHFGKIVIEF